MQTASRGMGSKSTEHVAKYADMFSAMGNEPRLRIMQLLLSAHLEGLVVNEIQDELEIPNSTLSHHLEKLKNEGLVWAQRESTFLRYTANTAALQAILRFLYSACCTRSKAMKGSKIEQVVREKYSELARRAQSEGSVRCGLSGSCCDPISSDLYGSE